MRLDPRRLVEGAKSVISVGINYYNDLNQVDSNAPKISKYAYGQDYHIVLKDKLKQLLNFISENIGAVDGRAFVDSAPVLDKAWAKRSGLGWIGKNSNLINKEKGSFFFLAELIVDLELEYDLTPSNDYCGTCTKCIEACPTEAIVAPYVVDGSRCISYLTIELKNAIPDQYKGKMDNWMFGCDVCQDVCPWNRFSVLHNEPAFKPNELLEMSKQEWEDITVETFNKVFKDSAVKRTKYSGLKRNIDFLRR
jgi:epoxyqueuosine reductase